ncbi:MAG: YetF domain-containing protein [Nocardioides sp.]
MWFDTWSDVVRVLLVGPASYAAVVLVLRASGKRTLSKLNAFDLVVTVALGSTLATIFLSTDVSWSEGVVALAVLALLQFLVALIISRVPTLRAVMTAGPALLLRDGEFLHHTLRSARLTEAEVRQAIRGSGIGDVTTVAAVVLESDGSLSVIPSSQAGNRSALEDLPRTSETPR